jgi:uncharacterized membrane protein YsdA (DUF1294 family)/cold shock CspA family protein
MRFEGTIKTWNDDRGFGFIEPSQGGEDIFVHIKAFNSLQGRPQSTQRVTFQVEIGAQGKKRASNVMLVQPQRNISLKASKSSAPRRGASSLLALPVFLIIFLAAHFLGHPPRWALWLYLTASSLTFAAYAIDKSAAQKGAWRTSENTLHTLTLIGGWPGALVAQQILRHKSSKEEFRSVFWFTVIVNVAGFIFFASPVGQIFLKV